MRDILTTCVSPIVWGTSYLAITELLPADRPLLVGALRALPVGLLGLAIFRRLPSGIWWWRALALGALNIGIFSPLLITGAYRLPGGVASTIGATQTFIVALFGWLLLRERIAHRTLVAATAGLIGVGLLVLGPQARLDPIGIAAAMGATVTMSAGTVLVKRWGRPVPLLVFTSWQLVAGGLMLALLTRIFEWPPPPLSLRNLGGVAYMGFITAGLAYGLWFRGIGKLRVAAVAFIALLGPLVATLLGWVVKGQILTLVQAGGALLIVGAIAMEQLGGTVISIFPPTRRAAGPLKGPQ